MHNHPGPVKSTTSRSGTRQHSIQNHHAESADARLDAKSRQCILQSTVYPSELLHSVQPNPPVPRRNAGGTLLGSVETISPIEKQDATIDSKTTIIPNTTKICRAAQSTAKHHESTQLNQGSEQFVVNQNDSVMSGKVKSEHSQQFVTSGESVTSAGRSSQPLHFEEEGCLSQISETCAFLRSKSDQLTIERTNSVLSSEMDLESVRSTSIRKSESFQSIQERPKSVQSTQERSGSVQSTQGSSGSVQSTHLTTISIEIIYLIMQQLILIYFDNVKNISVLNCCRRFK